MNFILLNVLNSNLSDIITHHTIGASDYIDLPLDINKANGIIVWRQSTSSGGLIFYIDRGVSCIHIADKLSNSSNIIVSSSATGMLRIKNNFPYSVQFLII